MTWITIACDWNSGDRWQERNAVWLRQPGVWQGHALLGEKNALWHSSRAPFEQRDMKASTCQFSQGTPLCAGLPRLTILQFNFRTTGETCTDPTGSVTTTFYHRDEDSFCPVFYSQNMLLWAVGWQISSLSCLRLLFSLRAVNGYYNLINSTLTTQWVNSLPSANCFRAAVAPDHIPMLCNDHSDNVTSIQWHFYVVHQQNKDDCVGPVHNHPPSAFPRSMLSHW